MAPLLGVILLSSVFVFFPVVNTAFAVDNNMMGGGGGQAAAPADTPAPKDAPATTESTTTGGVGEEPGDKGEDDSGEDAPATTESTTVTVKEPQDEGGEGGEGEDGQDDPGVDFDDIPVPPATSDSIADSIATDGGEGEPYDGGGGPVDDGGEDDFDAIQAKAKAGAVTADTVSSGEPGDKGFDGDLFAGSSAAAPPVPDQKPEPTTITNDDGSKSKIEVSKTGDIRRTVTKYLPDDDTKIRSIDGYNKDDKIVYTISNNPSTGKRMSVTYYNPDNGQKIGYTSYNYDGKITRHTTYHPDLNEDGSHKRKSVTTYHANQKEPKIQTFNGQQIIYTVETFDPQNGALTSTTDFNSDGIKIKRAEYDPTTLRKDAVVYKDDGETVDDTIDYDSGGSPTN
jgi:hypothetical protein